MQPRLAPRLGKENAVSHRSVVVWLFGVIFCFQVVYHVMMHTALLREEVAAHCSDALGSENSPHCIEAKMFHTWKAATLELEQTMEHAFASDTNDDLEQAFPIDANWEDISQLSRSAERHASAQLQPTVSIQPWMQQVTQRSMPPYIQKKVSNRSLKTAAISMPAMLPLARSSSKNAAKPLTFSKPIVLNNSKPVAWGNMTPWVQSLIDLQALWERRMQRRREDRHGAAAATTTLTRFAPASTSQWSNMTSWAKDLAALQARLESQLNKPTRHANHTPAATVPQEHEETLLEQIMEFGRELCMEPARRGRISCTQFVHGIQQSKGRVSPSGRSRPKSGGSHRQSHEDQNNEHEVNDASFVHRAMALGKELCLDPRRRAYDACKQFLQHHADGTNNTFQSMKYRQSTSKLSWKHVAGWRTALRQRRQEQILRGSELRHARWSGRIPKVVCITVLPCGQPLHPRLGYFINNFRLQSYEGPRELVLVFHHSNLEAARLVRMYTDGVFIKGLAVFGTEYPSAASFRFGVWDSDADVVARWDFNAWHHTQRLSMQVRALSMSGRPACFLRHWSVRGEAGDIRIVSGGLDWDASLVGVASWMHDKWYPLLEEFRMAIDSGKERHVVYVDLPELVIYPEGMNWGTKNCSVGTDAVADRRFAAQSSGLHVRGL